jgi:hypothetical protein
VVPLNARPRVERVVEPPGREILRHLDSLAQLPVLAHLPHLHLPGLAGHLRQYGEVSLRFSALEHPTRELNDLFNQVLTHERLTHASEALSGDQSIRQDQS